MEDENLAYIDDFIEIETFINQETFETSHYTGLEEFFSEHLVESNINQKLKIDGIDAYKIEVGDRITISPSTWSINFRKKHDLTSDNSSYELEYYVDNISIHFYNKNPRSDSRLPKIDIKLFLSKIR